jgi:hypothetical protein
MKIIFLFFLFISEFLNAQTAIVSEQKSIDKWSHAVFNIEVKKTEVLVMAPQFFLQTIMIPF